MRHGVTEGIGFDQDGEGPALVFLHGISWDRRIWQPLIAQLRSQFRCVALDLPGHGMSADLPTRRDYHLDSIGRPLHAAIAALGIDKPVMIGHSLGGAIASFYAAQFPVRAVLNIDQPLRLGPMVAAANQRRDMIHGPDFPTFWSGLMKSFGLEQLPDGLREWAQSLSRPRQEIVLAYWDQLFANKPDVFQDYVDKHLRQIASPYTAAYGILPGDDYVPWLQARLPRAEVIDLAIPSHFAYLLAPERFTAILGKIAV